VSTLDREVKSVTDLDDLYPRQVSKLTAQPAAEDCPEFPIAPPPMEATEPIQIQMSELQSPVQEAGSEGPTDDSRYFAGDDPTSTAAEASGCPGGAEESEPPAPTLPMPPVYTPDNDIVMPKIEDTTEEPQTMPYVEEDTEHQDDLGFPFSAFLFWLKKEAAKSVPPKAGSELVPEATSPEPEAPTEAPTPPNCQEDPNYHHQYPGCPYTGGCPYHGGHGYPTMKDFAPPKIEKEKKKTKKKKKEIKATPTSMLKKMSESLLEDLKNTPSPRRCGVDTMECRPSDARLPGGGIYDQPY
jgi:hypothetical protein